MCGELVAGLVVLLQLLVVDGPAQRVQMHSSQHRLKIEKFWQKKILSLQKRPEFMIFTDLPDKCIKIYFSFLETNITVLFFLHF